MNLDAILFFYNKFNNLDYNENDILIMSSYVSNNLINVNKSIKDNILIYVKENNKENILERINLLNETFDVPIYRLLLQESLMHLILINAIKKGLVDDNSYLDIVECLLECDGKILEQEESKLLPFIVDVLQFKKNASSEIMQKSSIIREYVFNNKDKLALTKRVKHTGDLLQKKIIVIRLFANGYVRYGNDFDINISYEDIIIPLIETKNYGQLKLVIGNKVINPDDVDYIISLIDKYVHKNMSSEFVEDIEKGEQILSETKVMLELIRNSRRNV